MWYQCNTVVKESLSARRAWIEIQNGGGVRSVGGVALRKESVDRNMKQSTATANCKGRSPQGERG